MTSAYAVLLGLVIRKSDIGTLWIDDSALATYGMIIAGFLLQDKLGKFWFFEESLLLADTSIEMTLKMSLLIFSDTDILFVEKELILKKLNGNWGFVYYQKGWVHW